MRLRISTIASILGVAAFMAACDLMETDKPAKTVSPEAAARALAINADSVARYKDSLANGRKADSLAWEAKRSAWKTDSLGFITAANKAKAAWTKDSLKQAVLMKKDSTKAIAQRGKDSIAWYKDSLAGEKNLAKDTLAWYKKAVASDAAYAKAAKAMALKYTKDSAAVEAIITKYEKLLEADQLAIDKAQEAVDNDDETTKASTVAAHAKALDKANNKLVADQAKYEAALQKANDKTTLDSTKGEEALAKILAKRETDSTAAAAKYSKDSLAMVNKLAARVATWTSNTTRDSTMLATDTATFNLKVLTRAAAIVTKDSLDSIKRYEDSVKIASADSALYVRRGVPVFSVAGGTYATAQSLELTTTLVDGKIYYTLDGSTPDSMETEFTKLYSSAIPLDIGQTVKARAVKEGYAATKPFGQTYVIDSAKKVTFVAADTLTTGDSINIIITTPDTSTLYYTLNGATPTTTVSSTNFKLTPEATLDTVTITSSATIKVLAVHAGRSNSAVAVQAFKLTMPTPVIDIAAGTIKDSVKVKITTTAKKTGTAMRYYSTAAGTVPTASAGTLVPADGYVTIFTSGTLKVVTYRTGSTTSAVAEAAYVVKVGDATVDIAAGEIDTTGGKAIKLGNTTHGTVYYYYTYGSSPADPTTTVSSTNKLYSAATGIPLTAAGTLKVLAVKSGCTNSDIKSFAYTLKPKLAQVTADNPSGTYVASTKVTLTATNTAAIYYTLNGTTPTSTVSSTNFLYNSTDKVDLGTTVGPVTVKAIAVKTGFLTSDVVTFTDTVGTVLTTVAPSLAAGKVLANTQITLTSAEGGDIYYTLNGDAPTSTVTANCLKYTAPVAIASTATLKAIAYKAGSVKSVASSTAYTVATSLASVTGPDDQAAAGASITLTSSDADSVYYTLGATDQGDPTSASTLYNASAKPVVIKPGVLKVISIKTMMVGGVATQLKSAVTTTTYAGS